MKLFKLKAAARGTLAAATDIEDIEVREAAPAPDVTPLPLPEARPPIVDDTVIDEPGQRVSELPFMLLMGHIEGVPSKQALDYVRGLALRTVSEEAVSYYGVTKTPTGIAFEVHEGGPGRALLPCVLAHIQEWGAFAQGEDNFVDIPTHGRTLRVVRTATGGISSVQLSEGVTPERNLTLSWGRTLRRLSDESDAAVTIGKVIFGAGVIACSVMVALTSLSAWQLARATQPPPGRPASAARTLPAAGFAAMLAQGFHSDVTALRYQNGSWSIETDQGSRPIQVEQGLQPSVKPAARPGAGAKP